MVLVNARLDTSSQDLKQRLQISSVAIAKPLTSETTAANCTA
jgi:hypothetical protein